MQFYILLVILLFCCFSDLKNRAVNNNVILLILVFLIYFNVDKFSESEFYLDWMKLTSILVVVYLFGLIGGADIKLIFALYPGVSVHFTSFFIITCFIGLIFSVLWFFCPYVKNKAIPYVLPVVFSYLLCSENLEVYYVFL